MKLAKISAVRSMKTWLGCALGALLWTAGCSKGGHDHTDGGTPECATPGSFYDCSPRIPCLSGQSGTQICRSDQTLSACECQSSSSSSFDAGHPGASVNDDGSVPSDKHADAGSSSQTDAATKDAGAHPTSKHDAGSQPTEDCSNGVDDDGNGKIDCADPACNDFMCLGQAPDGWQGPSVLYVGDNATPSCSGDYSSALERGGTSVNADAPACSSCSCDQAGAGCSGYLYFGFGSQSSCSDASCSVAVSESCVEIANACLNGSSAGFAHTALAPDTSACTPSKQSPKLNDPSFAQHVLACGDDNLRRGGCDPGNLCAPPKSNDGPFCIVKSGDVACPDGPYSDHRVYYAAIDDTRDCSACSCGSDCSYTWSVFDDGDTSCGSALATKHDPDQCISITPSSGKIRVGAAVSGSGSCTPSGGEPTGDAKPSAPFTACCLP